jgi:phosphopantothenoylcysteine synthetase/decarboxylase
MTEAAKRFVSTLTFHALSGNPVHTDPFSEHEDWNILHTTLADQAHLILIAPATADLIARLAHGFASDLVTSVVLASRAKILIAPAMNDRMFRHPLTQENIGKLRKLGYQFVEPIEGELVCGRTGIGHIAENSSILHAVQELVHA